MLRRLEYSNKQQLTDSSAEGFTTVSSVVYSLRAVSLSSCSLVRPVIYNSRQCRNTATSCNSLDNVKCYDETYRMGERPLLLHEYSTTSNTLDPCLYRVVSVLAYTSTAAVRSRLFSNAVS